MTHEAARRSVSRLWLRAFAGIVAVLYAAPPAAPADNTGAIAAVERHPWSVFAATGNSRTPVSVFLTDAGVYELDGATKSVRAWQRSDDGLELFRPKNGSVWSPMESDAAQRSGALRFSGKDADGAGTQFKQPVGMDREPGGTRIAVVNAGEWIDQGSNRFSPSVQVYSFTEETDASGGLSTVSFAFENEYKEAFYTTTNGTQLVISGIIDTSWVETNVLEWFFTTNWIHVISENPFRAITNETESADAQLLVSTNKWEEEIYHQQFTTNYEWRYTLTTNANYLSTATDVAFLGSQGLVVSITADDRRSMPSGFVVFDLSDPSAKGALYPVSDLPGVIRSIAVDPETGEIYASVPDAGAIFRFSPPGSGPGSWVTGIDTSLDIGVWLQDDAVPDGDFVAGVAGVPSSLFGSLSAPAGLSVWYPASLAEPVLLVADPGNNRIEAFDYAGTALFVWGGTSAKALKGPRGVWGEPGADTFAVADSGAKRVRIFDVDLLGVDADSILSVSMVWPGAMADWSVTNGLAFRDALHTNTAASVAMLSVESDEATNVLRFVVPPSRNDRVYTLSFAGAGGVLEPVSDTATVAAGETEGFFAFRALDGIVNADGSVPVYTATVTAQSGATAETTFAVLNADPVVTQAGLVGMAYGSYVLATGFSVEAEDVDADFDLSYYWFATTNFNWGVNNLLWAVSNREAFAAAGADWSLLNEDSPAEMVVTNWVSHETPQWTDYDGRRHYYETETLYASFFAEQTETAAGRVVNPIYLYVAQGKNVSVPGIFGGAVLEDVVGRMGGIIVLTVVDKDGGYAVVRFGKDYDSQDSEWSLATGGGGEESTAVYAAEFIDVSGTNVTFVVRRLSGESASDDTVTLQSSMKLDGASDPESTNWTKLRQYRIGTATFPVTNNLTPAGSGNVRFYRVVRP